MSYPLASGAPPMTPGYVYYDQPPQYGQPGFGGFPDTSGMAYPQPMPLADQPQAVSPTPAQPPQAPATPAPPAHNAIVIPPLQAPTSPPQQQQALQAPLVKAPEAQQMPEVSKGVQLGGPGTQETRAVVSEEETLEPCCGFLAAYLCFSLVGLVVFLIVVTITSQLVFGGSNTFCNNYWTLENDPTGQYELAGMPTVAVWSYIMGTCFLGLGALLLLEYLAASNKARAARDQIRVLVLLLCLFIFTWWITGNSWIIGNTTETYDSIRSPRGKIPQACKDGNMGDNSFYHFLLAYIIILDVLIPLSFAYVIFRTCFNKTFVY